MTWGFHRLTVVVPALRYHDLGSFSLRWHCQWLRFWQTVRLPSHLFKQCYNFCRQ